MKREFNWKCDRQSKNIKSPNKRKNEKRHIFGLIVDYNMIFVDAVVVSKNCCCVAEIRLACWISKYSQKKKQNTSHQRDNRHSSNNSFMCIISLDSHSHTMMIRLFDKICMSTYFDYSFSYLVSSFHFVIIYFYNRKKANKLLTTFSLLCDISISGWNVMKCVRTHKKTKFHSVSVIVRKLIFLQYQHYCGPVWWSFVIWVILNFDYEPPKNKSNVQMCWLSDC